MAMYIEIEKGHHDHHVKLAHHIKDKVCELVESLYESCEELEHEALEERRGRMGRRRGVRGTGRYGYRHDAHEFDDRYDY